MNDAKGAGEIGDKRWSGWSCAALWWVVLVEVKVCEGSTNWCDGVANEKAVPCTRMISEAVLGLIRPCMYVSQGRSVTVNSGREGISELAWTNLIE